MTKEPHEIEMLHAIAQVIYNKKGFNIFALDVRGLSTLTDFFLIAEGTVDRHVQALCGAVREFIEEQEESLFHVEGEQGGDWIVMDCGQLVVHLFIPELREKYALEELWREGKIIDLQLKV